MFHISNNSISFGKDTDFYRWYHNLVFIISQKESDTSHYPKLPEGWGNKDFSQLFEVLTSKSYQIQQKEIHQSGKYPVISQSALYIEGYSDIEEKLYNAETPVIIFGDHTRNVKYVNFDFIVGADGVKILKPTINSKFAYYLTLYNSKQIENRGYSRHFQYLKQQSWSIPSEKEQQKIVEIIEHYFRVFDIIITVLPYSVGGSPSSQEY